MLAATYHLIPRLGRLVSEKAIPSTIRSRVAIAIRRSSPCLSAISLDLASGVGHAATAVQTRLSSDVRTPAKSARGKHGPNPATGALSWRAPWREPAARSDYSFGTPWRAVWGRGAAATACKQGAPTLDCVQELRN